MATAWSVTVGIVTCYGLDGQCSFPGAVRIFFSLQRLNRHWDPHRLLANDYGGFYSGGKAAGASS
jgi:hypothetical protein